MTWQTDLSYVWQFWWVKVIVVIVLLLILAFVLYKIYKKRKGHRHNFIARGYIVARDMPRLVQVCDCGVAIHTPVYTRKELERVEGEI